MLLRHDAPEPAVCSQRLPPDWPVPGSALLRHAWDHPPMHQARGGLHHRGRKKSMHRFLLDRLIQNTAGFI